MSLQGAWSNPVVVGTSDGAVNPYVEKIKEHSPLFVLANEFAGGEWKDESGNDRHFINVGSSLVTSGGPGPSLTHYVDLDGVDDYLELAHEAALTLSNPATIVLWVWVASDASPSHTHACALSKGGSDYEVRHPGDISSISFAPEASSSANESLQHGEWVAVIAWNRVDDSTLIRVRPASSGSWSQTIAGAQPFGTATNPLRIGGRGSGDRHFDGRVAGVAILPGADLSLEEHDAIFDAAFEEPEELGDAYLIFRRTPPTGEPFDPEVDTPIATVPSNQLTYDDEGIGEAEYEYQVFARKVD